MLIGRWDNDGLLSTSRSGVTLMIVTLMAVTLMAVTLMAVTLMAVTPPG
jgi:hypothetical protein